MWRRCRFTEGSSLKDRLLWVFVTCVAPIVEEHDIGLCRVTDILNAIYVAETGYVRARVRIFVSLREYTLLLCLCYQWQKKYRASTHVLSYAHRAVAHDHETSLNPSFLLSFRAFSFFLFFPLLRVSALERVLSTDILSTFDTWCTFFFWCSSEKYFNLFVINNSRAMRVSKFFYNALSNNRISLSFCT